MGKIEVLLRIVFVSVFILQGIDLVLEKEKKGNELSENYSKYVKVHNESVMPFIRQNLHLNGTEYDSVFKCITNLPPVTTC